MSESFPKESRLLTARDFSRLREKPSFVSSGLFLFFYKPSENNSDLTRIGISVSKRISGKAVDRNYLKRKIREEFRLSQFRLLGKDVMVVVNRKNYLSLQNAKERLKSDLLNGFKKISSS